MQKSCKSTAGKHDLLKEQRREAISTQGKSWLQRRHSVVLNRTQDTTTRFGMQRCPYTHTHTHTEKVAHVGHLQPHFLHTPLSSSHWGYVAAPLPVGRPTLTLNIMATHTRCTFLRIGCSAAPETPLSRLSSSHSLQLPSHTLPCHLTSLSAASQCPKSSHDTSLTSPATLPPFETPHPPPAPPPSS